MDLGKRIERRLKRRIFGLVAGRASARTNGAAVDLNSVHRVLLVRANVRLGNLLLITPAIAALHEALPHARIDVLCDAAYGCLLAADPAVNAVVPINRRIMRSPVALAGLVGGLRSTGYDLVIECARGGSFQDSGGSALFRFDFNSITEFGPVGFRIAMIVPEPSTGLLVITGLLGLGIRRLVRA